MTISTTSPAPRPTPEQVVRDHGARILALATRLIGDPNEAEDVAQEVMVRVVRNLDKFRGESALPTWLHAVTVHTARQYQRARATRRLRTAEPDLLDAAARPRPDGAVLASEARERFQCAVAQLPPVYRSAYVLSEVEGRSHREVGAMLGLHPGTVKTRAHRARALLREALADYFADGDGRGRPGQAA
jgi:RNA polymerase sigma-70 factor (ECF subfamily)